MQPIGCLIGKSAGCMTAAGRDRRRVSIPLSHPARSSASFPRQDYAPIFAALGDRTRLSLIAKLCGGKPRSISELAQDSALSRQAITKHLRVLENAGIVYSRRAGRESRFHFDPHPVQDVKKYLDLVSGQWDQALARLKLLVDD
jgi:DNA-binding transcriptional ArsR family regulator